MAEGFLERTDLSKLKSDADAAGYNRGYSAGDTAGYNRGYTAGYTAGKKDGEGVIGGITGVPQGVVTVPATEYTINTGTKSNAWAAVSVGGFSYPSAYVRGKTGAVCHIYNGKLQVVSATQSKVLEYGYWYDTEYRYPIEIGRFTITKDSAGESFDLIEAVVSPATSGYAMAIRTFVTWGSYDCEIVVKVSYKYQWYLFSIESESE